MSERLLLNLDSGVSGVILRVALGAGFALLLGRLPGVGLGTAAAALAVLLFGLKLSTAVARRLLPVSAAVRSRWEWRRSLARHYDSYQWRKLVGYGSGILAVSAVAGTQGAWAAPLGASCLLSGATAEVVWRRKGIATVPPVRA